MLGWHIPRHIFLLTNDALCSMIVCLSLWGKLLIRHAFLLRTNLIKRLKHSRQFSTPPPLQPPASQSFHAALIKHNADMTQSLLSSPKNPPYFQNMCLPEGQRPLLFFTSVCLNIAAVATMDAAHLLSGDVWYLRKCPLGLFVRDDTQPRVTSARKTVLKRCLPGSHMSQISAEPSIKVRPSQNTDSPGFSKALPV